MRYHTQSPTAQANCAKLPKLCFHFVEYHRPGARIVALVRGEPGYNETVDLDRPHLSAAEARALVARCNARLGVTEAQHQALYSGTLFGFGALSADPDCYDDVGRLQPAIVEARRQARRGP